jgi:hypothetical protein
MAADYRNPASVHDRVPLALGEAEFVSVTTQLFVGPNRVVQRETTVLLSLSRGSLLAGAGSWEDRITQTGVTTGRVVLDCQDSMQACGPLLAPAQLILLNLTGELSAPLDLVRQLTLRIQQTTAAPVVVIGGPLGLRMQLSGVAGFVDVVGDMPERMAVDLLAAIHSAVSAPHRMNCVDIETVLLALGSAPNPAVFVQGVWRRRPVELLATAPENLSEALARTDRVLLVPSAHLLRPSEVRQLAEVLRNLARRPDLEVICAMPVDRASSSGLAPQFGTLGALIPAR